MSDRAPGIIPKIWGPHAWILLHSITFNYPEHPSDHEKQEYKIYFEKLASVLPCEECRESYKKFIGEGITTLDNAALKDRYSLTKWMYDIHNAVNNKLGVNYDISYDDVVKKYESLRAVCGTEVNTEITGEKMESPHQCFAPPSNKSLSYKVDTMKDCVVIPIELARNFIKYAEMRGLDSKEFEIIRTKGDHHKNKELWNKRNKECSEILNDMHMNDKPAVESSGPFEGFPTIDELRLILRLSSSLKIKEICRNHKKIM